MISQSETPLALLGPARLVPLLTIERAEDAVPLAEALLNAGLNTMEITLRTKAASQAIRAIVRAWPEAVVGAGNIMTPHDLALARDCGARIGFSPGATDALLDAAAAQDLPFVPGVATASELMTVLTKGFHIVKFFPAVPLGGAEALRAIGGAFPHVRFCPTGGTSEAEYEQWLALPNVIAVGGAWLAPPDEIAARDWSMIGKRAQLAVAKFVARRPGVMVSV